MKWILFLMFFATPAENLTASDAVCLKRQTITEINQILDCRAKFEAKRVWSLQSTSQMEFSNFVPCMGRVDQMLVDTNVAATMTTRAWCMCDDKDDKCPQDSPEMGVFIDHLRTCETAGNKPDCRAWVAKEVDDYIKTVKPGSAVRKPAELRAPGEAQPNFAPENDASAVTPGQGTASSSIRAYPRLPRNNVR